MAKDDKKKLDLVPAGGAATGIMSLITEGTTIEQLPKTEKLNLPPMVKPKMVEIGQTISGQLVRIVDNFSGKESLRGSKLMHLRKGTVEFLFPITRSMKSSVSVIMDDSKESETGLKKGYPGKVIYLTRTPDGGNKNNSENPMLNFDIRIQA